MLYIVGGVSRAGKSRAASEMNKRHRVPWLSLDALRWGLTHGAKPLGIHSDNDDREDGERLWPILSAMTENILFDGRDYLIEGVCLFPNHATALMQKYQGQIRACFLGYPRIALDRKIADVTQYDEACPNDWLRRTSPEYIRTFLGDAIKRSEEIEADCVAARLGFFDTGVDYENAIERAVTHLTR